MVVIGVDRYRHWRPLSNAVGDAMGAAAQLRELGFDDVVPPLLDEQATAEAIEALVTDELTSLAASDNLIVFFAGHGGTRTQRVGERDVRTGYLIPVDGAAESHRVQSWIEIDPWLRRISKLPPRHILVILDACFSGIALSSAVKWGRDSGALLDLPFSAANARPSRLVITSALDDERAMDSGPRPGHSLFTGCLIEGLTGGVRPVGVRAGRPVIIGSELGRYVRHRVATYEGRPGWQQTPDLGSFDFDERGEMLIPVRIGDARVAGSPALARASTKQLAAQPDTALAADTVVDGVAEIEAAAIDAMAADAAAIEAAAIAAMPPASAATGSTARTAGPSAVDPAAPRVASKPDRRRRSWLAVTIAIAGLVTVSVEMTLSLRSADPAVGVTPRAAFPTAEVDLDAAAAQPPPADSAVDERLIGPPAGHLDDPAPEPPPDQPPVAGVTVKRDSGPTTRPAIARPRVGPPPAGAPASGMQGPTATAHPHAGTSICPTWFKQPRGAEVTWNDVVAKLPVELPLPCNVEVTLVFRQPNHLGATRKFTATVGGEPQIVRLRRAPVVPGSP
jgi:caspase domain-containing protein